MRISLSLLLLLLMSGCTYTVEVITEPPGARIEVNKNYVGRSPISVQLEKGAEDKFVQVNGTQTIVAYPSVPGQFTQSKVFRPGDTAPTTVFFDMRLQPISPAQELHIYNHP